MKKVKKSLHVLLIFAILIIAFGVPALAEGASPEDAVNDFFDLLPQDMREYAGTALGIDALFYEVISAAAGLKGRIAGFFITLVGVAVFIVLLNNLNSRLSPTVKSFGSVIASSAVFCHVFSLVKEVALSLGEIRGFFSSVLPLFVSVTAMGGGTFTAGTGAFGTALTLQLTGLFTEEVLGSLCVVMVLGGLLSSMQGFSLTIARGVKNFFTRGVGLVATVLLGTLAMQTLISSCNDNMAIRAARYAVSGFVPVVGSTVGGALSTLVGSVAYAKGVIGAGAISVIVVMAVTPLVLLLLYRFCFFLVTSFLNTVGVGDGAACIAGAADALDALIAVYAVSMVTYVLEIAVLLAVSVG